MRATTRTGWNGRLYAVGGLLGAAAACFPAAAAEWRAEPYFDFGAIRDDNVRLETGPGETASGYITAARLDVERRSEVSRARLNVSATHTRYTEGDLDDKTEYRLRFGGERQTSERGALGLDAEYRRDALFENVLIVREGVGDVRDVDVALTTETQVRRHYRLAQPSWRWLLTERSRVDLAYRFTDVSFSDRAPTSRLTDYEEDLFSATYRRQLSPRDDLILTANAFRYRPLDADAESETVELLVGRGRAFSETLRGSVSIGASRTREQVGGVEGTSSGTIVDARIEQRAEISRLTLVVSRGVTPSGIGRALRTDQLRAHWERGLTPQLTFVFDALWLRSRLVEGFDPAADRRYYELSPRLRWQWLEDLAVVGSYRYRRQQFESEPDSADSSAVFLGVSYRL